MACRLGACPFPHGVFTAETHDCMEKVRPGTGRETGLGHAGDRAPKVGALGDAWSNCRKNAKLLCGFLIISETQPLNRLHAPGN